MAIAFKLSSVQGGAATSHTHTIDLSTGADKLVIVSAVDYLGNSDSPTSATCDGVTLTAGTLYTSQGGFHGRIFWGLTSATSATTSVVCNFTNGTGFGLSLVSAWTGVGSVRGTEYSNHGTSTGPITSTVTSATGDTVIAHIQTSNSASRTITPNNGAVEVLDEGYRFIFTKDGAASLTVDGTLSGSEQWQVHAISLVPAGAATSNPSLNLMTLGVG